TTARTLFAMCAPLRSLGAGARLVDPRTGRSAPSLALQRPARRHTSPAVQDTSFYYRIPSKVAAPSASPSIPHIQKPACHRTARRLLTALQSREKPVLHFLHLQEVQLDGGLAPEEGDQHRHLVPVRVNLAHRADELRERSADNLHIL